jgi:EmrB/QacA subfamily drug resistance transporter
VTSFPPHPEGTTPVPAGPVAAEPVRLRTPAGRWVVLATVLASGMALLDATAVNVALPAIGRDLGAELAGLQWTLSGYTLALASLILLGGALGDRYGRRRVFLVGVVWFAVTSLGCGLAQTTGQLIGARVLQGIGGALLTPGSLAILQSSFPHVDRPRAIGLWSSLGGIAGLVGPFLGGLLIDTVGWRWVFLVNAPVAVVVVLVAVRHVPESRDPERTGRFDAAGAAWGALALAGTTYALIAAGDGPGRPQVWTAAAAGVLAGVAFVVRERRAREPMLPLGVFADREFTGANLSTFAAYGALGGCSWSSSCRRCSATAPPRPERRWSPRSSWSPCCRPGPVRWPSGPAPASS